MHCGYTLGKTCTAPSTGGFSDGGVTICAHLEDGFAFATLCSFLENGSSISAELECDFSDGLTYVFNLTLFSASVLIQNMVSASVLN